MCLLLPLVTSHRLLVTGPAQQAYVPHGLHAVVVRHTASEERLLLRSSHETVYASPLGDEGRTAVSLRLADQSSRRYHFILHGDDSVVWLADNVASLLASLSPDVPLILSDGIDACAFPTAVPSVGPEGCLHTPKAALCRRSVVQANDTCLGLNAPETWPSAARGAIWSRAAVAELGAAATGCEKGSGDGVRRMARCAWFNGVGLATTNPYPEAVAFGYDYTSLLKHIAGVQTGTCGYACRFALERALTTRIPAGETARFWMVYSDAKRALARLPHADSWWTEQR